MIAHRQRWVVFAFLLCGLVLVTMEMMEWSILCAPAMRPAPSKDTHDAHAKHAFDHDAIRSAIAAELKQGLAGFMSTLDIPKTLPKITPCTPTSRVALCATAKYESPYIAEWVLHHWRIGFGPVWVNDDTSEDRREQKRLRSQIALLQKSGVDVQLFSDQKPLAVLDDRAIALAGGANKTQFLFATQCAREATRRGIPWVGHFDIDEFMLPAMPEVSQAEKKAFAAAFCFSQLLVNVSDEVPAVMVARKSFLFGGETVARSEGVMKRFTKAVPTQTVKSIMRADRVDVCASAHQCVYKDSALAVTWDGKHADPLKYRQVDNPVFAPSFLAHYRSKSIQECLYRVSRGFAWMPDKTFDHCAQTGGERDASAKYFVLD